MSSGQPLIGLKSWHPVPLAQVMAWCRQAKKQAITGANVDPDQCCYMVSLDHNEFIGWGNNIQWYVLREIWIDGMENDIYLQGTP